MCGGRKCFFEPVACFERSGLVFAFCPSAFDCCPDYYGD